MRKQRKFFTVLLAASLALPGMTGQVEAAQAPTAADAVVRLQGSGRVETAVEVSQVAYEEGADTVVLAGYRGEVDALTGTLLAGAKDAPLLLTEPRGLSKVTKDEIVRLKAKTIYILGGESIVSKKVESDLEALGGITVERVSGANRFETAHEVAKAAEGKTTHVFLALGANESLADALAVGPVSAVKEMPVLLTTKNYIPDATKEAMKELGVTDVIIVGGEAAISQAIKADLEKDYRVDRVEGSTREGTAEAVAKRYFNNPTTAIITNDGRVSYADALVGGYLGALLDAPILLTQANRLSEVTQKYIFEHIDQAFILGGSSAIAPTVVGQAEKAVAGITEEANGSDIVSNIRFEVTDYRSVEDVRLTFAVPHNYEEYEFFNVELSENNGTDWHVMYSLSSDESDITDPSIYMGGRSNDLTGNKLVYNRVRITSIAKKSSQLQSQVVEQPIEFTIIEKGEAPGFKIEKGEQSYHLILDEAIGGTYQLKKFNNMDNLSKRDVISRVEVAPGQRRSTHNIGNKFSENTGFSIRKVSNMTPKGFTTTKASVPKRLDQLISTE